MEDNENRRTAEVIFTIVITWYLQQVWRTTGIETIRRKKKNLFILDHIFHKGLIVYRQSVPTKNVYNHSNLISLREAFWCDVYRKKEEMGRLLNRPIYPYSWP